jgi:CRP-like cAMP-binding protein/membrane protease YdiL (CAAX protease family)
VANEIDSDDRDRPEVSGPDSAASPRSPEPWQHSALFEGVTPTQIAELKSRFVELKFSPGQFILREAATDSFIYVLTDGIAHVTKTTLSGDAEMRIGELGPGDVLGELKIVDPEASSASVVAVTPVTAFALDLDTFAKAPALADARAVMLRNVGRILAARLRARTSDEADALKRELDESQAREHAGRFIVLMFTMIATYNLAISALAVLPVAIHPPMTVLSFILAIWTVIPVLMLFRNSPFPLESYGLTLRHGGRVVFQALLWTAPLLILVVVVKWIWIRSDPALAGQPLFDPTESVPAPFSPGYYCFAIFLYSIHAPLQELVGRAGLQGTLQHLIPVAPGRVNWKAILISDLLFSAAHVFIGFWFCVAAFVPGMFWGWMFSRQRSLLGVIASHIVVGIWLLFVVGLEAFIGGQ